MIDKMIILNIVQFIWVFAFVAFYHSTPFPTKNLYKLRYDSPAKLGNWYIGKRNLYWLLSLVILVGVAYTIDANGALSADIAAKTAEYKATQAQVYAGVGGVVGKGVNLILIAVIAIVGYKVIKAMMASQETEDALENKAKEKLFTMMYHEGKIKLPLKQCFGQINDDTAWIQTDKKYQDILREQYPKEVAVENPSA